MSENPKELVELARLASQQETNDGGMLYSRLADCIEKLLEDREAIARYVESLDTGLEAIRRELDEGP